MSTETSSDLVSAWACCCSNVAKVCNSGGSAGLHIHTCIMLLRQALFLTCSRSQSGQEMGALGNPMYSSHFSSTLRNDQALSQVLQRCCQIAHNHLRPRVGACSFQPHECHFVRTRGGPSCMAALCMPLRRRNHALGGQHGSCWRGVHWCIVGG